MDLITPYTEFKYHPHQAEAVRWMTARESETALYFRGGILADEMGLGKTWMTIGLLLNAPVTTTLLLVPPALQSQWSEALTKANISHRIFGVAGAWKRIVGNPGIHVTIATYDRAWRNMALIGDYYDRIICDEGHILKNGADTRRFRGLMEIRAPTKWLLTGTPIQNRKSEFKNLLAFLGADMEGVATTQKLKTLAEEVMLRRIVSDVRAATALIDKPTHYVHPVSMPDNEESSVFKTLVGQFEHAIETHANSMEILELYLRIRQFVAHPAIYVDAMIRKYGAIYKRQEWVGTASKMAAFTDLLETLEKAPTIVFTTFKMEMAMAKAELEKAGYRVWTIAGGMTDLQRERVIAESKAYVDGPIALVVQIVCGGAGLNLQHCHRIIFLSSHWNPAVVDQAVARAYRIGQIHPVTVHHLLLADDAEKNLDRYMAAMHGRKRKDALEIHEKLYCESAIKADTIMARLDAVLPAGDDVTVE